MKLIERALFAGCLFVALAACDRIKEPETGDGIVIPQSENTSPVINAGGGTATVSFTAGQAWTASVTNNRVNDWLSVSPTSGNAGKNAITITVSPSDSYDERNGTITIKCGKDSKSITVTQKQKGAILLTKDKMEFDGFGGEFNVEAKASITYTVTIDVDWITQAETKSLQTSYFTFNVAENDYRSKREGHIVFSDGEVSETISVYQSGMIPSIILTQNEYTVSANGDSFSVELRSNVDVSVSMPDVDWIRELSTKSLSTHTYDFVVDKNESYETRTAEILFTNNEDNLSESVTVTQMPQGALIVAQDEYVFSNHADVLVIQTETNVDLETSVDVDWIEFLYSVNPRSMHTTNVVFSIHENAGGEERSGTITIRAGEACKTIKVTQRSNEEQLANERAALMEFYYSTNGPNWKNNRNWGSDKPLNDWYGLSVNMDGTVSSISLNENNLNGTIPESFGVFQNLEMLLLQKNRLSGSIPESIGNLKKLRILLLGTNSLSGSIPESIGNLTEMQDLQLYQNHLTGPIPEGFVNMTRMRYLRLEENHLSGCIPEYIGNLTEMVSMRFDHNDLSGSLPESICKMTKLDYFVLDYNDGITGPLPEDIGNMTNLSKIYIQYCPKFSGHIPESICNLTNLEILGLSGCNLSGELPRNIGNLTKLKDFRMCSNSISGTLPESIGNLHNLNTLMIRWNSLSGDLPESIGNMRNLQYLYLSGNRLTGGIPDGFINLSNLILLDVSGNCMNGTVSAQMLQSEWWQNLLISVAQRQGYGLNFEGAYISSDFSQNGKLTLLQSHTKGKGIKLLITGEGFSDRKIADGTFAAHARQAMDYFFEKEPYTSFRDYFDVYILNAVSRTEIVGLETAFDVVVYDDKYVWDPDEVRSFVQNSIPEFNQKDMSALTVIVILNENAGINRVNCTMYDDGFAAGLCTVSSAMKYEVNHEIGGHGFGKLADEYWDDDKYGTRFSYYDWLDERHYMGYYLNADYQNDPQMIYWKDFIGNTDYAVENIGIYEGGLGDYTYGIYRPTENSIMRTDSNGEYNAPSRWAIYQRIKWLSGENCSFEEFLEYDRKNLEAIAASKASSRKNCVERSSIRSLGAPPRFYSTSSGTPASR